jgi:hypothetical protein
VSKRTDEEHVQLCSWLGEHEAELSGLPTNSQEPSNHTQHHAAHLLVLQLALPLLLLVPRLHLPQHLLVGLPQPLL